MLESKAVILAKIESSYGADPTPTAGSNAILTTVPGFELIGGGRARDVLLPYYGKLPPINVGEGLKISFSVEVRGQGSVATTPPRIGCLLRACGLTETIGGSYVEYTPHSTENGESVTIYLYRDGVRHIVLGCVGNVKLAGKTNEVCKLDFELTGLYSGSHASDQSFPTPTFGDATIPPVLRSATFAIDTYSGIIESFNLDLGNAVAKRADANNATGIYRYFVNGRQVKGGCDPEVVVLSTWNPWTRWDATTAGAITITIGQSTTNRLLVTLPSCVKEAPKYGAREGALTYDIPFTAHPTITAGNNEIALRFN